MPIELGKHEDGYKVRISDDGCLEMSDGGGWKSVTAASLCGEPVRHSTGLNGEAIVSFRLPLKRGRSIIVRRIGVNGSSYYDVDRLQTSLERDLAANRHCIR